MPLPAGWPAPPCPNVRSGRYYVTATATANFEDCAYLFGGVLPATVAAVMNISPTPYVAPGAESTPTTLPQHPLGGGRDPRDAKHNATISVGTRQGYVWMANIRICNDGGAALEYSFDGTNVHGKILATDAPVIYRARYEAGIAVRGNGATFRIEAW